MKATVGDRLVIPGRHVNDRVRSGEIVEVHGPNGAPPYLVRWSGTDEPGLIFPGPDAHVERGVQDTADVGTVLEGDAVPEGDTVLEKDTVAGGRA